MKTESTTKSPWGAGNKQFIIQFEIRDDFGSLKNFCRITKFNYYTAINAINGRLSERKTEFILNQLMDLMVSTPKPNCDECINDNEREMIRVQLLTKFKTVRNFVKHHPGFSGTFIHNVIAGKRKIRDDRFFSLLKSIQS
jgi:hypothetical protein